MTLVSRWSTLWRCKVRQWPPGTGSSSLGVSCQNEAVRHAALTLFRDVGYHGLHHPDLDFKLARERQNFVSSETALTLLDSRNSDTTRTSHPPVLHHRLRARCAHQHPSSDPPGSDSRASADPLPPECPVSVLGLHTDTAVLTDIEPVVGRQRDRSTVTQHGLALSIQQSPELIHGLITGSRVASPAVFRLHRSMNPSPSTATSSDRPVCGSAYPGGNRHQATR